MKKIGDVIGEFLRSREVRQRKRLGDIHEVWNFVVGEEMSKLSNVAGVRNGVLTVEIESPAARHELAVLMKDEILERLKTLAPHLGIASVRYVMKSHPGK